MLRGGSFESIMQPLNIAQKSILKRNLNIDLFGETGVLSVRQIFVKDLLVHIYKNFYDIFPSITHTYTHYNNSQHPIRTKHGSTSAVVE